MFSVYKFSKILLIIVNVLILFLGCLYYYLYDHHQFYRKSDYILEGGVLFILKNNINISIGELINSDGYYFCMIFPVDKKILSFSPFKEMIVKDKKNFEKDILKSFYSQDENHRWLVVMDSSHKLINIYKVNPYFVNYLSMNKRSNGFYCFNKKDDVNKLFDIENFKTNTKEF